MRNCSDCGALYEPTGRTWRCLPCRRVWEREWRERRKAAGRPVVSTKMGPGYEARRKATYYCQPEVKARRAAQMRKYRNDPVLRERHEARWQVNRAIASGRLQRQPCEQCGCRAHAHHDDYAKPLDVRWLCSIHHREHHAQAEAAGIRVKD